MHEVVDALKTVHQNGKYLSANAQNIIMDNLMSPGDMMAEKDTSKPIPQQGSWKFSNL